METRAYADLMFAFAAARLGDERLARTLMEGAARHLDATGDPAHQFLARAFQYRIGEALAGQIHQGRFSNELTAQLHALNLLNRYVADRLREQSRVLEPDFSPDPLHDWKRNDGLSRELSDLSQATHSERVIERLRTLLDELRPRFNGNRRDLSILYGALCLEWQSDSQSMECLIEKVYHLLQNMAAHPPVTVRNQDLEDYLQALVPLAIRRAVNIDRRDLVERFVSWIGLNSAQTRWFVALFPPCVAALCELEMDADLALLLDHVSERDLPPLTADAPREVVAFRLGEAAGRVYLGLPGGAEDTLRKGEEILAAGTGRSRENLKDFVGLACDYFHVFSLAPIDAWHERLSEHIRGLPNIPNTFTTSTHFSRFHLRISDTLALTYAPTALEPGRPSGSHPTRFGPDERDKRAQAIPSIRELVHEWIAELNALK